MPINPVFIRPLDYPANPPPAPAIDFSPLRDIGQAFGQYREQQAIGQLLQGAIDPKTGTLDIGKAATAIAVSGRDPTRYLTLLEAEKRAREAQQYRQESLDIAREGRDIQRKALEKPGRQIVPPSLFSPGGVYTIPNEGDPTFRAFPPTMPAPAPGPQSALSGPTLAADLNPEEAPPYRVAGPPPPPPAPPAPATPAATATPPVATSGRNEAFLRTLPPNAQTIVKGIAEYEIDPATLSGQDREQAIAAAKTYRPDYSMAEYQKRGTPPSGEIASRVGLAKGFIEIAPQIKERLQKDELNSVEGRMMAVVGQGGPGELRRAIDEGAEALLRGLTGAGMSNTEAGNYQRRYQFSWYDTKETQLRKLNELERALRFVSTEVGKGRGGEDMLKDFATQFGKPVVEVPKIKNEAEANRLVGQARSALQRDPGQRDEIIRRLRDRGIPNAELLLGR